MKTNKLRSAYLVLNEINGLGPTGISKYLHMHKSDLFVMWDDQIFRDYYGISTVTKATATPPRYTSFLKRMRAELIEAIGDYSSLKGFDGLDVTSFREEFDKESLLRIIDKYNYVNRGRSQNIRLS